MKWIELRREAHGFEDILAFLRCVILHDALDDVHVLVLLLLDLLAECINLLNCIFEADKLFVNVFILVVGELRALLLKLLHVLS